MTEHKPVLAWHFVGSTLRDGRPIPPDGKMLVHGGPLEMCITGLHASERIIDALQYAPGHTICRVECGGKIVHDMDKIVCTQRTILWRVDGGALLREYARACARDVLHLWAAPAVVKQYLETGDDDLSDAASNAASNAARDASSDATWVASDAARAAARAASNAASNATWAARDAARDAAWAASNAASAASVAAWEAQNTRLEAMVTAAHDANIEALFRHETALGHMPPYGRKWFSDADYERLVTAAQKSLLVMQFLQSAAHIYSGEDFIAFTAQAVLRAAAVIEQNEKYTLDVLMRHSHAE